jgi:hypothetical protein
MSAPPVTRLDLKAPLTGVLVPIEQVPDPVFAQKIKQNSVPSRSPAGAAEVPTRADKGSGSIRLPVATPLVMGSVIGTGVFRAVVGAGPLRASQPGRVRSGHGGDRFGADGGPGQHFHGLFGNRRPWAAVALSLALQLLVRRVTQPRRTPDA